MSSMAKCLPACRPLTAKLIAIWCFFVWFSHLDHLVARILSNLPLFLFQVSFGGVTWNHYEMIFRIHEPFSASISPITSPMLCQVGLLLLPSLSL